jgi:type II secretory pathway pseudopilin PulG
VIVVLAILSAVAVPKYFDHSARAKTAAAQGTLGAVRAALANYYQNSSTTGTARYPALTDLTTAGVVMQHAIPASPYNNSNVVRSVTTASLAAGRAVDGTQGWCYFVDNAAATPTATFWCNSRTATTLYNTYSNSVTSGGAGSSPPVSQNVAVTANNL